ncbi:MAG: MaoC family dehydratase N-terminal domain-containing protein [Myxococcales bacterium]|nr:MaoC family dehydratase N-terminal domain-containing protein [Myxococcales bacterium]
MVLAAQEKDALEQKLRTYVGIETSPPEVGRDPINQPMIRHWCEAMGDTNPIYTDSEAASQSIHGGIVAPPTMLQAWVLRGIQMADPSGLPRNKQLELHQLLTDHGYTSVVATNCEQGYDRYLRPGDEISLTTTIESISEEKATALGIGYFINTRDVFRDQSGEQVGWMTFRVLKFKPAQAPQPVQSDAAPTKPIRPRLPMGHDNAWWWEGIQDGKLLIQQCGSCGELRHPPRPMCGKCQSLDWGAYESRGRGSIYSYTVMHHPRFPGFEHPFVAALIELGEGTRIISNVVGCEPDEVHIGMPVELSIENVDEEMKLPLFRPLK